MKTLRVAPPLEPASRAGGLICEEAEGVSPLPSQWVATSS